MNTNNLNTALYEKMATEQEKYRDFWIPPRRWLMCAVILKSWRPATWM